MNRRSYPAFRPRKSQTMIGQDILQFRPKDQLEPSASGPLRRSSECTGALVVIPKGFEFCVLLIAPMTTRGALQPASTKTNRLWPTEPFGTTLT